jgi:hypothetical protein
MEKWKRMHNEMLHNLYTKKNDDMSRTSSMQGEQELPTKFCLENVMGNLDVTKRIILKLISGKQIMEM